MCKHYTLSVQHTTLFLQYNFSDMDHFLFTIFPSECTAEIGTPSLVFRGRLFPKHSRSSMNYLTLLDTHFLFCKA